MDTPGGLITSMDDIIDRILRAEVPVVVYVWPSGGHAASAGTYITYASHVAAMAPTTRIGAATPVSGTGDDIEGDLRDKIINDSVSRIRELAILRDRNADWGEDAVRDGITAGASEAIDLNIVEYIATDLDDLLAQIDGTEVELQDGQEFVLQHRGRAGCLQRSELRGRLPRHHRGPEHRIRAAVTGLAGASSSSSCIPARSSPECSG